MAQDDFQPMYVEKESEKDSVMETVWLTREQRDQLRKCVIGRAVLLSVALTHESQEQRASQPPLVSRLLSLLSGCMRPYPFVRRFY